ncbi:MAG TPA: divalent metal cation transporter [Gemmatimonadaceae bacterium]|nr:divalent metal cation transporter [Gemmatimonadaceae bacterium]
MSTLNDRRKQRGVLRTLGLGLITGAADDDPSAVGTYASAGAKFGPAILWTAPVLLPMMVAVVYLSGKLGQVAGEGLFAVLKRHYPSWFFYPTLAAVLVGNTIEAAADIGGIAAALSLVVPLRIGWIVVAVSALALALQLRGSYRLIRNVLRLLALTLLAYIGSALLARPEWGPVVRGTLVPSVHFDRDFLAILVAVIGTSLSAYLYTWQSNQEVEEEIAMGRRRLRDRRGATRAELRRSWWDVVAGMIFSNVIMYFIILSTAATLHAAGRRDIDSAVQAAQALRPLAGNVARVLFALGVVGVGFLAVPVMTTGAAYDLSQALGWRYGLQRRPGTAKRFYGAMAGFTLVATGMNFLGINPMKALVWAGIVQGFSTPPLMLLIMRMTNDRAIMGTRVNGRAINVLGWITTVAIVAATLGLVASWVL